MSTQLLKEQKETINLENTRWTMYDVNNNGLSPTNKIWCFTSNNNIHDEPTSWDGHWNEVGEKITITRNVNSSTNYQYEAILVNSDVFVVFGTDETPNHVLLGVRNSVQYVSDIISTSVWEMYDIYRIGEPHIKVNEAKWLFRSNNTIYDMPKVWEGTWTKISDSHINIHRRNIVYPNEENDYDVPLNTPSFFVAFGSDEHPNRILLGARITYSE